MADLSTFKDIQDRVIQYGYSEQHRTQIKGWVNDAYRDLCRLRRWSWLIFTDPLVTTAGSRTVALPTPAGRNLVTVMEIKPNDPAVDARPLIYEDIDSGDPLAFERLNLARATVRGTPARYSIDGTNVVFDVLCDRAYTYSIRHYDVPVTELVADAATLLLPSSGTNVLVYMTLMRAAAHDRNPSMMSTWDVLRREALQALEANEATRVTQTPARAALPSVYGNRFGR